MSVTAAPGPTSSGPAPSAPADAADARGRYGVLLAAAVASVGVQGAVPPSDLQRIAVTALAAAMVLLALHAARASHRLLVTAAVFGAVAVAVVVARALAGGIGEGAMRAMNAALVALAPPAVAVGVLRDLRAAGTVRLEAVTGVLVLYLLIGMVFGFAYGAIDRLGGAPFFAGGAEASVAHCLYYSYTTLATVGFGDLVARSDLGHTVSVVEALVGQIYLVTVVSVIVSNLGRPARARR